MWVFYTTHLQHMKTVSLVLGSGGARGFAHIGVIHWLENNGYVIKSISGCSAGALIGGVYAAGKLEPFEQWAKKIRRIDIVRLLDISWGGGGFFRGDKFISTIIELVGKKNIEDLDIPFTAIAANIENDKEVWLQKGDLFDAIRASISMPLFFTPFNRNGSKLIDGGILDPVPIAPTLGDETDVTIAVNLGGKIEKPHPEKVSINTEYQTESPFSDWVGQYIKSLQKSTPNASEPDWTMHQIASQAFDIMQSTIAKQKLTAYPPDHLIEIPRNACMALEFDRAEELIELGYQKTEELLGQQ